MATVALDVFAPEITLECFGATDMLVLSAIRTTCIDFFKRTLLWNEVQAPYAYTAGTAVYAITAPADTQVAGVLNMNIDGLREVYPQSLDGIIPQIPAYATTRGAVATFVQPSLDTVQLIYVPSTSGTFTPTVAYAPSRTATSVSDVAYNQYFETIKHGALGRLMSMHNQPWTNPNNGIAHLRAYNAGVVDATIQRNRGNARTEMRVLPRPFV